MAETDAGGAGDDVTTQSAELRLMSQLLDRLSAGGRLFNRFDSRRKLKEEFGYLDAIDIGHYREAYQRYSIAKRIIELPAQDTWKEPPTIFEVETPQVITSFESAWVAMATRLRYWHYCERADIVAGLGRYAVIMLDVAGHGTPDVPLRSVSADEIVGLSVFAEDNAAIKRIVTDQTDPRFHLPEVYEINLAAEGPVNYRGKTSTSRDVHWTRIIHVADGLLEDDIYGTPRLEAVFNRLDDLEKVAGGCAESFFQRAANMWAFVTDKDFRPPKDTVITGMKEQLEEWQHRVRRVLNLWGTTPHHMAPEIADPRGVVAVLSSMISGTTGIPLRLLFGSERGDLASQQDRSNWSDRMYRRQQRYAEPLIVRPFVDRCIKIGALPAPASYSCKWPKAQVLTELEQSEVAQRRASAVKSYSQQGSDQFPQKIVDMDEVREELGWAPRGDTGGSDGV